MEYSFKAYGHENVLSKHKSTFEITTDEHLTLRGDCIIGTSSDTTLNDFPEELREKIMTDDTKIEIILKTPNATDTIIGYGSSDLTLTHPSDMVCRKSDFTCNRTLMIKSDKAACDFKSELIDDLKNKCEIIVTIKV